MRTVRVRNKLVLAFLAIALIALALSAWLNLRLTHQALQAQNRQALAGAASQTATKLDAFVLDNLNTIRTQSLLPSLAEYLELPPAARAGSQAEIAAGNILDSFRRKDQVHISSYALFDTQGRRLLDTYGSTGKDLWNPPYLEEPLRTGLSSVSSILLSPASGVPSLYFSSPVRNANGEILGVLRVRYHAHIVQKLIYEQEALLGPGSFAILLDEDLVRIADSHEPGVLYQPLAPLEPPRLERLKAGGRIARQLPASEALPDFLSGIRNMTHTPHFTARAHAGAGEAMLCTAMGMTSRPWTVVFAQPQSAYQNAFQAQLRSSSLLLGGIALIALLVGLVLARTISRPLTTLTALAGRMAQGDLRQRVQVSSSDEIGTLASTFNTMAEALEESHQKLTTNASRLATLLDTIPDAVFIHRADGHVIDVNRRCLEMFGFDRAEMLALKVEDISGRGYTQQMAEERVAKAAREGRMDFEWVGRRKDGSEFPLLVRLRGIPLGEEQLVIAVVTDMTERKKLEGALLQAEKLEALGTLAGGIAHDFNNLLMGIQSCVSLMLMELDASHPHAEKLRRIEEQVKSGAGLTRQLLGYARGGRYEVATLDLNELLKQTLDTYGRTKKEVAIHTTFDRELWCVEADQSQLEQVFVNLFVNAWQAMPAGGHLYLETRNVTLDAQAALPHQLPEGHYVQVTITDTGIGMDEATRARIFEPFFTTKEMGRGTGLGLASAYGIIKNHGGSIGAYSEKGHGSTFHVYLPASLKTSPGRTFAVPEPLRGSETLLLVDDESMILEVCKPLLERLGYRVLEASGGHRAIELYREHAAEIDLVVLDMIMPEMGGGEVFEALQAINPRVRVLLASGYSLNDQARKILDRGCVGFIQKPFGAADLSRKLRSVLDQAASWAPVSSRRPLRTGRVGHCPGPPAPRAPSRWHRARRSRSGGPAGSGSASRPP